MQLISEEISIFIYLYAYMCKILNMVAWIEMMTGIGRWKRSIWGYSTEEPTVGMC